MYVELDQAHAGGYGFEMHLREVMQEQAEAVAGDTAVFSKEAIASFKEAAIEPIKNGTFTLEQMERRINTVRAEILRVWNSALPEKEKWREISAKENEIALLQAGQFTFAKASFSKKI